MIPQETIDRILQAAPIVEVVKEFVALKKRGAVYVGCCPFHSEKTPSFIVSPAKGVYKCFGCGKGGSNVFEFIQAHETISFPEAVKFLGNKFKIPVEHKEQNPEEKARADRRESLRIMHEFAAKHFTKNLEQTEAAKYLLERKVTDAIIKKFRIGFALKSWNNLITEAQKAGYKENIILDSSLAGKNEKNTVFDWFRNRITLPFLDLNGNVIGFTGRILEEKENESKYLNSRDTELFSKGKVLFGLYQAKKAIIQKDECYLVEGNFDVTSFHQAGVENTVCGSGTALTVDQIRLIRRFTNNITIIYDGDSAGIKASFRSIDLMLQEDISVRAIALPIGEDPDSFARKQSAKELQEYLEKNRKDFITFKYEILKAEVDKDPLNEAEFLKELLESIAIIPDPVTRGTYKRQCVTTFKLDEKLINEGLSRVKSKAQKTDNKSGWICLDEAKEEIEDCDEVFITSDIDTMYGRWSQDIQNVISHTGKLKISQIQELNALTNDVTYIDDITKLYDENGELTEQIQFLKQLYTFNFNLKVPVPEKNKYFDGRDTVSFIEMYIYLAEQYVTTNAYDQYKRNKAIEDAAELLASSDNSTIHISSKTFASKLNIKEGDFKKIMKPYLEKKRSRNNLQVEAFEDDNVSFDPDRIPDYVDKEEFRRWGFFPYRNSAGEQVRYVFRTEAGGLQMIGNFYIEPLFHIKDLDPNKNKRVIKINNAEQRKSYYLEMTSSAMIDFGQFKKVLFNEGGNVFTKGKSQHHEAILASIAKDFPEVWELNVFGQQHEGFWAFNNAIFADGAITYMNDLGLAPYKDKTYYSPAFSKIFSGLRKDNDRFENNRYFVYRENNETTFEEWARLMDEVYKLNHNGKWALLFAIMATFRSIIYPIDRLFTAPFFIGPTESGKSQIAISIRSLFMAPETPLFNLNSGSDAAFFSTLESLRDVVIIMEEYNDVNITDTKFQGLKAAVYDGEGKQKRKDATSKDIDVSKINGVIVLLGQEGPERDDGSLGNRCVLLHVPKKDDWTEEEAEFFRILKGKEKAGLSNVFIEILKQRDKVANNFQKIQRSVFKELKESVSKSGLGYQTRILNTVSLFAAICKLWEDLAPELKLPFTYKEFFAIAKAKILSQSEAILSTNRVSVFFQSIMSLLNDNKIKPGREYKIEKQRSVTIMETRVATKDFDLGEETKVLYLRINAVYDKYKQLKGDESLKFNNLLTYLKDHPSYIGSVKSTRFTWIEIEKQFIADEGRVADTAREAFANTSAVAFKYDLLKDMVDLEKYGEAQDIQQTKITAKVEAPKPAAPEQKEMNFAEAVNPEPDDLPF